MSSSPDRDQWQINFRKFLTKMMKVSIVKFSLSHDHNFFFQLWIPVDILNIFVDFWKCEVLLTSHWENGNSGYRSTAFYPSTTQECPRSSDPRHPILGLLWTAHPTALLRQTAVPSTVKPPSSPKRNTSPANPANPANHLQTTTMPRI